MFKYTFTKEQTSAGAVVQVVCNGKHVAQLNLADRMQRGFSIKKLNLWLGGLTTKLVAFGETITIERETEITF